MGIIGMLLCSISLSGYADILPPYIGLIVMGSLFVLGFFIAIKSNSGAKAWRKVLITSGIMSFMLPFSGIISTSLIMARHANQGPVLGAQAAGMALGGTFVSGVLGFIGFFLGVIFLVIDLLVGRDKQGVYIQVPPNTTRP